MTTTTPAAVVCTVDVVVSVPAPAPLPRTPLPRRLADYSVIALFVVGFAVVSFGTFVRQPPPLDENRDPHPPPPLAARKQVLQDYPKWFDLYYGDRVGYRDVLLGWQHRVAYHLFDEPASKLSWIGRDGWLYLNVSEPTNRRDLKPTLAEKIDDWATAILDRHAFLKARGIEYVVFVVPDKSSVYPEFLRGYVARHPPPEPTAAFVAKLRAGGVRVVDPLPALIAAKESGPLYYKLDSHWNLDGARVAYKELVAEIGGFTPLRDDEFDITARTVEGDLGRLVGIPDDKRYEPGHWYTPRHRTWEQDDRPAFTDALPIEARPKHLPPRVYSCDTAPGPRVVLFRDSFGEQVVPFFRADFRRVAVVSSDSLELSVLDAEKPAVVVQQFVARKLYSNAAAHPPGAAGYSRR